MAGTVHLSQSRHLRRALKELEDLVNGWYKHDHLVSHEEVQRKKQLLEQIREAGFEIYHHWDDENNRTLYQLRWAPYPTEADQTEPIKVIE